MQSFLPLNLLSAPEAVAATANSGSTVEAQLPIATFAAVRPSIGLYLRVVAALMVLSGFFGGSIAAAQGAPEWTWMGGSSSAYQPGVYGTLGTPAAGNFPGGRNGAASWTDSSGNLWLFGGYGVPNDLWKYQLTATNLRNNAGGNLSGDGGL